MYYTAGIEPPVGTNVAMAYRRCVVSCIGPACPLPQSMAPLLNCHALPLQHQQSPQLLRKHTSMGRFTQGGAWINRGVRVCRPLSGG